VRKLPFICLLLCVFTGYASAQKYTEPVLSNLLDSLSKKHPGLGNSLQLNVNGLPLSELISSVALENNLNFIVDPSLNQVISYNFFDAKVKDMLLFLYLNFEIEYEFVGSIISVSKRARVQEAPVVVPVRKVDVSYNPANEFLSMDLKNDTLWKVTEELTRLSGTNFVISPDLRNKIVNAYLQNRPFEQVLDMFAKSNTLALKKEADGFYTIGAPAPEDPTKTGRNGSKSTGGSNRTFANSGDFRLEKNENGNLDVFANNVEINEILKAAAQELNTHYVLHANIDGKANVELKDITFDELLKRLLNGTKFNYSEQNRLFVIGENKMEGLRKTELIRLENRTIENVKSAIPATLMNDVEVSEFLELNGLIVSGSERSIIELKSFISAIDVIVPMVQIDVMLIFSERSSGLNTGIKAGLKDKPTTTSGTVFPELNVDAGAATINAILNAISGFGVLNLGQVTENFYISLSALESNNVIDIESTPKISTLNGQKASITIGETTYYQETQVNVQTSVTNQGVLQSKIWKEIEANLSVKIKPFVSADEYVTLSITVQQDDFSGKVDPSSPPNITTQTFESVVRVKNGEVILLGGLEKKKKNDSGSGVPFLSRIPVLKWFFSSRQKEKEKSKLHILVRPTVTY
jgi:type IV pilus assembly protein PilQ